MLVTRYQTGIQEAELTITDEGEVEEDQITDFDGKSFPTFEIYIPQLGKHVEFQCRQKDLIDNLRELCQAHIDDPNGDLEEMPEELTGEFWQTRTITFDRKENSPEGLFDHEDIDVRDEEELEGQGVKYTYDIFVKENENIEIDDTEF